MSAAGVAASWSLAQAGGAWLQCDGTFDLAGPYSEGFPPDTAGVEFDPPNAAAYLLVADGAGGFARGAGPAYVWSVTMNQPISNGAGTPVFNLANDWTGSIVAYEVSGATADAGCIASIHMTNASSGFGLNQTDLVSANDVGAPAVGSAPTIADPHPAACAAGCYGSATASVEDWTLPDVAGTWTLCNGSFGSDGGFPADAVGIQFDAANATAHLMVAGDGGGISRGPGPNYVWTVTEVDNVYSGSNVHAFRFANALSSTQVEYTVLGATADAGCGTSLHLNGMVAPLSAADLILTGP
jgi:hypothetical protein